MKVSIAMDRMRLDKVVGAMIRNRLWTVLGRFSSRIDDVSLRLLDVRGARGGMRRCTLVLTLSGGREIVVKQAAVGQLAAASAAIDLAASWLSDEQAGPDRSARHRPPVLLPSM